MLEVHTMTDRKGYKEKNKYFTMMRGLRGCYMPDDVWVIKVTSQKQLLQYVMEELEAMSAPVGKGEARTYVKECWRRHRTLTLPLVLPTDAEKTYGIHLSHATRGEWEEFINEGDEDE
jgi:hypothetical protein